jgi:DNA modification methylase
MPDLINKKIPASVFSLIDPEAETAFQREAYERDHPSPLKRRFLVSPFSVLHPDAGDWKKRKQEWIQDIGLRGEDGRSEIDTANNICSDQWGRGVKLNKALEPGGGGGPNTAWLGRKAPDAVPGAGGPGSVRRRAASDLGQCFGSGKPGDLSAELRGKPMEAGLCHGEVPSYDGADRTVAGTSIFDPVLTELLYLWYGKKGGSILDPFAGGATRGVVAAYGGYSYTGIEVRPGQVNANIRNAKQVQENVKRLFDRDIEMPNWIVGDSSRLEEILTEQDDPFEPRRTFDFLIACPPYYDLEVYSFGQEDGSAKQTYEEFLVWYKEIFRQAVDRLAWNRFAGIVVGDIRDHSDLRPFHNLLVEDTTAIFRQLGLYAYEKVILETAKGSLPVRVGGQFPQYRKLGRTHQHILLFWKGDADKKAIPAELGILNEDDFEGEASDEIDT